MKVAILNYTGTVGKTTIAAHLLSPRMNDAPIFAIESINETAEALGVNVEKIKGDKFRELLRKIFLLEDAIIDVGASNIEAFLNGMIKFDNSHEEIDLFLVPVTSGTKEQKETISMLTALSAIGIAPEKIHVIFNRVENTPEEEFQFIFAFQKKSQGFVANPDCSIYENEIFDALAIKGLTIDALSNDETDYKTLLKNTPTASEKDKNKWSDMFGLKLLSKGVKKNLDIVYSSLIKKGTDT